MKEHTKPEIHFFNESTGFVLRGKNIVRSWLEECMISEKRIIGEVNFIFCSDNFLRKINKKYLDHDYFTDVITFPTSLPNENKISGDIFISIDRIRENAGTYGVRMYDELHRVMAHGVLHLCGYGDKSEKEIKKMRKKENEWLGKR